MSTSTGRGRAGLRRTTALGLSTALAACLLPTAPASAAPAAPGAPAAAVVTTAAPAPVADGTGSGDSLFPTYGSTGYDVRHYGIALTYGASGSIRATTTIDARAAGRLSSFSLDLEGLTVDQVVVAGRRATVHRDQTKLLVTPARPVSGRFTTVVRYHGTPVTHTDPDGAKDGWIPSPTGVTVLSEPVGAQTWFPNDNTPHDKASYDIAITAPKRLAAASNGVLRTRRTKHGATTWRWRQRQPMASYLAMVSIGRFDVYRSKVRLASGRRVPSWVFVDPTLGTLEHQRALLGKVIAFSEQQYGPYPFDAVGFVAQKLDVGYALETQTRPFFDTAPDDATMVHELAHQWFGDSVTPRDWGDIWLNEGFATYAEANWAAAHGGPTTWEAFGKVYEHRPATAKFWLTAPDALSDPADLFGNPVYVRGGLTLEALRHKIGDATMRTLLRRWTAEHRYGVVDTGDFVRLAQRISGTDLDTFFHVWLYVPARPEGY